MAGETCPRCHHKNGYPIPWSIHRSEKMVFECRDCSHQWVKRNAPKGGFIKWFVYGFGFLFGILFAVYELFHDKLQVLIVKAQALFESLVTMIKGFF